jgi:hypothetical protein
VQPTEVEASLLDFHPRPGELPDAGEVDARFRHQARILFEPLAPQYSG